MVGNLHVLRETTLRDIPATLRKMADDLEKRDHPGDKPLACVVVVETGEGVEVSFTGEGEPGPVAHLLLHLGAYKMMRDTANLKGF